MPSARCWGAVVLIVCGGALPAVARANTFAAFDPRGDGPLYRAEADGRVTTQPQIRAQRINGSEVAIDGRLDDPTWHEAEAGFGFTEFDPNRGEAASVETVFKVAYDDDAFYFAVACFENDVTLVTTSLSRRDRLENTDQVSIYVDPYHDRTTGYNFRVNPHGVQMDQYVFNDGDRDLDWDAVWEAETHRDERGWYVEMRIPFSSVRYRPQESMTWGLQVYRWMHGRGEDTAWVNWDRNARGFVSRFGEITDLRGVPAPRQLEVVPYMVQRSTDPSTQEVNENWNAFYNFGADVKFGVTADLTLNAAFQPDFGQVEADPAILNLSPFEVFFEEKRPFFIEGSRFFQHPDFNLVYTRRIGTGGDNARIRYAAKLTGKTGVLQTLGTWMPDVNVAALFAATDVTVEGQAHNFLKRGMEETYFGALRLGTEFSRGNHRFNVMGTSVVRDNATFYDTSRDAFTGGFDFDLNFKDRTYNIQGSAVGTMVEPSDASTRYGTGGSLDIRKVGGIYRGGLNGRWEHDQLDPNDMGILNAPDEYSASLWLQRRFSWDDDPNSLFTQGNVNFNLYRSWLYAGRSFADPDSTSPSFGEQLWSYDEARPQALGTNINGWMETRYRWSAFYGVWHDFEGSSKFETRSFDGVQGPLMTTPSGTGFWAGFNSDWRKSLSIENEVEMFWFSEGRRAFDYEFALKWVQSSRMNHRISLGFVDQHRDAQWVRNLSNPGQGIGGVSYVFGALDARVFDVTLRSNVLFSRSQSLEVYVQPFLSIENYRRPQELATPDSYDLRPFEDDRSDEYLEDIEDERFDIDDFDRIQGSVNLNLVYRWEYRPGSALYLVWTHSRFKEQHDTQGPGGFDDGFTTDPLLQTEPTNVFLAKLTYWFSI